MARGILASPSLRHLLSCWNFWQLDGCSLVKCGCQVPALPTRLVPGCSSALCALASPPAAPHHAPSPQVQGAEEAQKERQRQKELESNYRRVWGSRGGEGTGDLEEFDF